MNETVTPESARHRGITVAVGYTSSVSSSSTSSVSSSSKSSKSSVFLVGYPLHVVADGVFIASIVHLAIPSAPLRLWLINVPLGHELSFRDRPACSKAGAMAI